MAIRRVAVRERALGASLSLGPALVDASRSSGEPWSAASLVRGPAIVLGAGQRAGRVVDLPACSRLGLEVFRRATTGTALHLGDVALVWTLALPRVGSLFHDATARSLLNRNVRGFLRGFEQAGVPAHYFGREWISVRKRPGAIVGYDLRADGAVLLEVFACWRGSLAIPLDAAAADERAVDRYKGAEPVALSELLHDAEPLAFAEAVLEGLATRAESSLEPASLEEPPPRAPVVDPRDPIPDGLALASPVRVPIGWIDRAADRARRRVWIGGDMLTSEAALRALERATSAGESATAELAAAPLDGARPLDLEGAARELLAPGSTSAEG